MNKIIVEGQLNSQSVDFEDGGAAMIVEPEWEVINGADDKFFIRLQSWDESIFDNVMYDRKNYSQENAQLGHETLQSLVGKKIRITIEEIE